MLRLTDVGLKTGERRTGWGWRRYIDNAVLGRVGVVVLGFYGFRRDRHEASAGKDITPYAHKH